MNIWRKVTENIEKLTYLIINNELLTDLISILTYSTCLSNGTKLYNEVERPDDFLFPFTFSLICVLTHGAINPLTLIFRNAY